MQALAPGRLPRRLPAVVLVICAFTPMGGVACADPTPIEIFRRFFKEKQPELRVKAVAQLAGQRGAAVVEALVQALGDDDELVHARACAVLAETRDATDEIAAFVRFGLGAKSPQVRREAAQAMTRAGARALREIRALLEDVQPDVRRLGALALAFLDDRASAPLLSKLIADKDALVRAAACEALGRLLDVDAAGTASAVILGDRAVEPRVAACEVLARSPKPAAVEHLGFALLDGSWSLRVAASRALAEFGVDAECARPAAARLVRAVEDERRSRVRHDMADALFALTGIDFGPEADRWKAWFKEAGATFTPPPKRPNRGKGLGNANGTQGHLLDLPMESEHVCFVLDSSHSMLDPIRFGADTTRWKALLRSFEAAVGALPSDSWINLIPFSSDPRPMKPALFAATPNARQGAVRFLEKLSPDGRTNIYDSLELALRDSDADTIVLLTDGAPSEGKRKTRTAIVAGVKELNRYRLARIHTVEVGSANTAPRWKGFLREIADATGGYYLAR